MFFQGIRFRLASLFVLFFGVTLILFSFLLFNSFQKSQQAEFDIALYNYTVDVVSSLKVNLFGDAFLDPDFFKNQDKLFPFSLGKTFILFRSMDGKILVRSQNSIPHDFPFNQEIAKNIVSQGKNFQTVYIDADLNPSTAPNIYRLISQKLDSPAGQSLIVQVAAPMDLLERQRHDLVTFFGVSIPIVLILSTLMGWFFTSRALSPVTNIIAKAKKISVGNLSERLPLPKTNDEIHQLTISLNDLLNRLEEAFASQERFVSDASHQLKTPLAILKGELDLIRNKNVSPDEMALFINSAAEEVLSLSKIVENLLLLARVEAGIEKFNFHSVRLEEVLLNQIAKLEKLAKLKNIKIVFNIDESLNSSFDILGEEELLSCLFHNLIENAIKYSPSNSTVNIQLTQKDEAILIDIRDSGSGVPLHEQEKIFDRFYRSSFEQSKIEGVGLGLSLARKIAEVLGGNLSVHNAVPGPGAIFSFQVKKN